MHAVEALDAQKRLTSLLDEVAKGGWVLITRDGKRAAKLVPAEPGYDRAEARQAAEGLLALAKGLKLGGLSIRDLTNEGRR